MTTADRSGRVVTFYSFKGGVGRTMALANAAVLLACRGLRVLAIDFDLEAPGLGRYLARREGPDAPPCPGVIELFTALRDALDARFADDEQYVAVPAATVSALREEIGGALDRREYVYPVGVDLPDAGGNGVVDVMPAGVLDETYNERREALDWRLLYERYAEVFPLLAEALRARWDYVLIDSRTGLADTASVCTSLMPDALVAVLVPNAQSLEGVVEVARQAAERRHAHGAEGAPALLEGVTSARGLTLDVLPLLSRVENAEDDLKREWLGVIRSGFESIRDAPGVRLPPDLRFYFDSLRVPYRTRYAFGEEIAALRESTAEHDGMASAFEKLVGYLLKQPSAASPQPSASLASVAESVARVEATVVHALEAHPRVVASFASLGFGTDPRSVTRALLHDRTAHQVMTALNQAVAALSHDAHATVEDHDVVHRLFNECLRFAVNWREVVAAGRAALRSGTNAFELPTRKESVMELLLAGIDDRLPAFDLSRPEAAVGMTRVSLPAVLRRPLAMTTDRFVEAMVKHIAGTVFADNPDLAHARARPNTPEAVADVEGTLRALGYERASSENRPYYVIFDSDELDLWRVACDAQRERLPSLQLVRWTGAADPGEAALTEHIKTFLKRRK